MTNQEWRLKVVNFLCSLDVGFIGQIKRCLSRGNRCESGTSTKSRSITLVVRIRGN